MQPFGTIIDNDFCISLGKITACVVFNGDHLFDHQKCQSSMVTNNPVR